MAEQSLTLRVGSRFTHVVRAADDRPIATRIMSHGPVLLAAAQAVAANATGGAAARVLRSTARQVAERADLESLSGVPCPVRGAPGIARMVIALGTGGAASATIAEMHHATEMLATIWVAGDRSGPFRHWVEPMLIGAVTLEASLELLGADQISTEGSCLPFPRRVSG